jgi:predicted PurR-regulated permease PerM
MISQVLMASLTGVWGIIFATPLVLITIILVQDLYTNPMNEKSTNNAQLE